MTNQQLTAQAVDRYADMVWPAGIGAHRQQN